MTTDADFVGIEYGDLDDAANVNNLLGHGNLANYVFGDGMLLPHQISGGTFDLTEGKFFILLDTEIAERTDEYRHKNLLTCYIQERTGVPLADPSVDNFVYMDPELGTDDSPQIRVETQASLDADSSLPEDEWLQIATIHPDATYTLTNRAPDGVFDQLEANTIIADYGDITTIEVDKIIWPGDDEQTQPGIQIGDVIDNKNNKYDANPTDERPLPDGTVYASVYSDKTDEVKVGGIVPGGTLTGTIDIKNNRYETSNQSGTPVDNSNFATNSGKLQNRDATNILYEQAVKSPSVVVPRGKIGSGTPSGSLVHLGPDTFKLWSVRISVPNSEEQGNLRFRLRAGDGTVVADGNNQGWGNVAEGDYLNKNPLSTIPSRTKLHLELYHTNGSEMSASAFAGYTIE